MEEKILDIPENKTNYYLPETLWFWHTTDKHGYLSTFYTKTPIILNHDGRTFSVPVETIYHLLKVSKNPQLQMELVSTIRNALMLKRRVSSLTEKKKKIPGLFSRPQWNEDKKYIMTYLLLLRLVKHKNFYVPKLTRTDRNIVMIHNMDDFYGAKPEPKNNPISATGVNIIGKFYTIVRDLLKEGLSPEEILELFLNEHKNRLDKYLLFDKPVTEVFGTNIGR